MNKWIKEILLSDLLETEAIVKDIPDRKILNVIAKG